MPSHNLSEADLVTYESAAAGHEGVLQSAGGDLVIKPCTDAEVKFYQLCAQQDEPLLEYMPKFMGTLQLGAPGEAESKGTASTLSADDPGPLHGKRLQTEQSIVLENIAAGYLKPNVLDLKLGARLWDDAAPPDKRRRLDDVASKSTSGSLGFRIAGMRVWQPKNAHPEGGEHKVFDKMYGRKFNEEDVKEGFEEFFGHYDEDSSKTKVIKKEVVERVTEHVRKINHILETMEVRMYSASILIAFEGDHAALQSTLRDEAKIGAEKAPRTESKDEEDEEEEILEKQVCRVVMIDFAHATLVPGQGPDENVLTGVKSILQIMEALK